MEQTLIGSDGLVRGARLRVNDKGGRITRLRPPISQLYPLEVHVEENDNTSMLGGGKEVSKGRARSQRTAAIIARENIQGIHDFEQDS